MELFVLSSAVWGYHVYRDLWEPSVGEKLVARREFDNQFDKFAVKVLNGEETVGHLPREYSRIAWYFLARGGSISVQVSGHRQHCKQLCGGVEIPCRVTFTCSRKAMLNRLKALLKVLIYANLWHGVQMFSQISRIPDLIQKFWAKRCGLYAGVYGISGRDL